MRALKHTTISLLILTALSGSALANQHAHKSKNETAPQINLAEEQAKWAQQQHAHELKLIEQRATFLQLESLLKSAVKNNRTLISYFAIRLYLIRCGCVAASPKVFFFHSS